MSFVFLFPAVFLTALRRVVWDEKQQIKKMRELAKKNEVRENDMKEIHKKSTENYTDVKNKETSLKFISICK